MTFRGVSFRLAILHEASWKLAQRVNVPPSCSDN